MSELIPVERIENVIFLIRGQKVIIDRDLAVLYNVPTKRLNEQVKRNIERFPSDFMFYLTKEEKAQLVAICDRFHTMKHSTVMPLAFTENGIAMLSSVLRSKQAIQVNIQIMRAFTKLRFILSSHKEMLQGLNELERETRKNSSDIQQIFEAIRKILIIEEKPKRPIGFLRD